MAGLAHRHPRLTLLNLEAVATASLTDATTWLSSASANGVLPAVLDAEGLPWDLVPLA